MELPNWLTRKVYEIAPYVRLAWAGEPRKHPNELNAGGYAIVELVPSCKVGSLEEPNIPQEIWHVTTRSNRFGQATRARIDRGPIFAKTGSTTPDWDVQKLVPVYVGRFKDYEIPWVRVAKGEQFPKFTNEMVYHGACIPMIRRWESSRKARVEQDRLKRAKELQQEMDDISRDGTERLWSKANETGATTYSTVTREERSAAHEDILNRKADFEGYFAGKSRY